MKIRYRTLIPYELDRRLAHLIASGWLPTPATETTAAPARGSAGLRRCVTGALSLLGLVGGVAALDRSVSAWIVQPNPSLEWMDQLTSRDLLPEVGAPAGPTPSIGGSPETPGPASQWAGFGFRPGSGKPEGTGDREVRDQTDPGSDEGSHFFRVVVTAYSSSDAETDSDPELTATLTQAGTGLIALSRDLLRTFTPGAPYDFGDRILIPGVGIYQVEDTMHERWERKADIWFPSAQEAKAWGRRAAYLTKVGEDTPLLAYKLP